MSLVSFTVAGVSFKLPKKFALFINSVHTLSNIFEVKCRLNKHKYSVISHLEDIGELEEDEQEEPADVDEDKMDETNNSGEETADIVILKIDDAVIGEFDHEEFWNAICDIKVAPLDTCLPNFNLVMEDADMQIKKNKGLVNIIGSAFEICLNINVDNDLIRSVLEDRVKVFKLSDTHKQLAKYIIKN
jgi:hypothetical protein